MITANNYVDTGLDVFDLSYGWPARTAGLSMCPNDVSLCFL